MSASDSCNVDCAREKMKLKLQNAMRTLRRSISKKQFYVQFSGTEYEVAQKPSKVPEGAESCSTGQVLQDGKCGKCWDKLAVTWHQGVIGMKFISPHPCFLLSELWWGDVLQRRAGTVCPVPSRYLPGYSGSAVLWTMSQYSRTGYCWSKERVSVWR